MNKNIEITVYNGEEVIILNTYKNEYENLMELLNDTIFINNFGECKGVGKCCTCLIEITSSHLKILESNRNELSTLKKHNILNEKKRLACQIIIDESLHNIKIAIENIN